MLALHLEHALKNTQLHMSLQDTKPKIYAVKGPSGIGKTTILNIIAGLKSADKAHIEVNKRILTDTHNNIDVKIQQRNIGYLFQDYQLFPNMDVYQNITFMA
ncbi:MAG: ATP-binding cassette domain-containing protein, partial [Staphylococcus equorum]|nr:ATP-binding cassette domain-containing protein [Staphylococcus equorum]